MLKLFSRITVLLLLCALVLPALAQRKEPRGETRQPPLSGRILSIDAQRGIVKIALYVRVADKNAPGKMPEIVTQRIVRDSAKADELEQKAALLKQRGQDREAERLLEQAALMRKNIDELMRWREIQAVTTPDTKLIGVLQTPIAKIPVGTVVSFFSFAEGTTAATPDTVTLIGEVRTAEPTAKPAVVQPSNAGKGNKTYYQIIGSVVTAAPLTVDVNGTRIKVNVNTEAPNAIFTSQQPVTVNELKPNYAIRMVRVLMDGETTARRIEGMLILIGVDANASHNPFGGGF